MPTFRYQAMGSANGAATIDAPDRGTAIRELVRRGVTPTKVEAVASGGPTAAQAVSLGVGLVAGAAIDRAMGSAGGSAAAGIAADVLDEAIEKPRARSVMSRSEVAAFVRELATAVQAGLPLIQGLRTIARQASGQRQRAMLGGIIERVEHGSSLADAMAAQGRSFNDLTVNMVRAGEASGKLGEVLMQAADLLDRDVKLRRSVLAATLYPMILAALITIAVIIVVTVIVPQILGALGGATLKLPWPTRVVKGVADFFAAWYMFVIPAVLVGVLFVARTFRRPGPKLWLDRTLLKAPILGRLLRDVAVGRFTRTLGTLVAAGIPAVTSLRVTKGTLGNKAMEHVIDEVCEQVTGGKTIADPMEKSGYFPPMLVQIINLGERSGKLDQMLTQAADAFENKTETSLKLFTTALPPILVVVLACVVGFVVLAILLPLLELQSAVGG